MILVTSKRRLVVCLSGITRGLGVVCLVGRRLVGLWLIGRLLEFLTVVLGRCRLFPRLFIRLKMMLMKSVIMRRVALAWRLVW